MKGVFQSRGSPPFTRVLSDLFSASWSSRLNCCMKNRGEQQAEEDVGVDTSVIWGLSWGRLLLLEFGEGACRHL